MGKRIRDKKLPPSSKDGRAGRRAARRNGDRSHLTEDASGYLDVQKAIEDFERRGSKSQLPDWQRPRKASVPVDHAAILRRREQARAENRAKKGLKKARQG